MYRVTIGTDRDGNRIEIIGRNCRTDTLSAKGKAIVRIAGENPGLFGAFVDIVMNCKSIAVCRSVIDETMRPYVDQGGYRGAKKLTKELREYFATSSGMSLEDRRSYLVEETMVFVALERAQCKSEQNPSVCREAYAVAGCSRMCPEHNDKNIDVICVWPRRGLGIECKARLSNWLSLRRGDCGSYQMKPEVVQKLRFMVDLAEALREKNIVFTLKLGTLESENSLTGHMGALDGMGFKNMGLIGKESLKDVLLNVKG